MTADLPEIPAPNFFLVGAAKSGTTALASYLDSHADVFVCKPKEPNFFALEPSRKPTCRGPADPERLFNVLLKYSVTDPNAYEQLFAKASNATAVGDASVRYLYEPTSAGRIHHRYPHAKVLVLLRDPVARMHSHYHMNRHWNLEPLSFDQALEAEDKRVEEGWGWDWHYRRVGMFGEQLERYIKLFGREQVCVLFQHDLNHQPEGLWSEVCEFLAIDASQLPDFEKRPNVGRTPSFPLLKRLVWGDSLPKRLLKKAFPQRLRQTVSALAGSTRVGGVPRLAPDRHKQLAEQFATDRQRLEELLGRRMPW